MPRSTFRPQSHVLGDKGAHEAAGVFIDWKWAVRPIQPDYGEDLDCQVFLDERRTNLHFRCQVKSASTQSTYIRKLRNGDYSVQIATNTLTDWLTSYFPVFLIVYDENANHHLIPKR